MPVNVKEVKDLVSDTVDPRLQQPPLFVQQHYPYSIFSLAEVS